MADGGTGRTVTSCNYFSLSLCVDTFIYFGMKATQIHLIKDPSLMSLNWNENRSVKSVHFPNLDAGISISKGLHWFSQFQTLWYSLYYMGTMNVTMQSI